MGGLAYHTTVVDLIFLCASMASVLGAALMAGSGRKTAKVLNATWKISAMVLLVAAALPVFQVPFTNDSQILRHAFAARDVFADWNHPFLSYLLNRPAALLSFDPVALRIIPFMWFVAEAVMFGVIAGRFAGPVASALTVVWMAMSVRLSVGMIDLSDWNLAGMFLAGMILWIQDYSRSGWRRRWIPVPAILVLGGCFSSYLMAVPAALLTLFVLFERGRFRIPLICAVLTVLALIIAGDQLKEAILVGRMSHKLGSASDVTIVLRQIFADVPPFGLRPVMLLLVVGGFGLRVYRGGDRAWTFSLVTAGLTVGAILSGMAVSSINGGYYFGLVKGPCFVAAAVLLADGLVSARRWLMNLDGRRECPRVVSAVLLPLIVVVVTAAGTFRIEKAAYFFLSSGVEHIPEFIEVSGRGAVGILSNDCNAIPLLKYFEAREGRMDIGEILRTDSDNWVNSTVLISGIDDGVRSFRPARYLVLWRNSVLSGEEELFSGADCIPMFAAPGVDCRKSKITFCYYDCHVAQGGGNPVEMPEPAAVAR